MHSTHPGIYFNFRHNRLPSLRTVVQLIGTPCLSSSLSPSEASKWRAGWIKKYVRTIQNNPSTASKMITQLWPNPIGMHYEQQNRTREHHLQKIMPSIIHPLLLSTHHQAFCAEIICTLEWPPCTSHPTPGTPPKEDILLYPASGVINKSFWGGAAAVIHSSYHLQREGVATTTTPLGFNPIGCRWFGFFERHHTFNDRVAENWIFILGRIGLHKAGRTADADAAAAESHIKQYSRTQTRKRSKEYLFMTIC